MALSAVLSSCTCDLQANIKAFEIDLSEDVVKAVDRIHNAYRDPSTLPIDD